MKKFLNHIRNRVLAGLIFLVPLFAVILILQKLWKALSGSGHYISKWLGFQPVLGGYSVAIATTLLLLIILYFFGWLVKFSALNRMKDWIETKVLQYIPGYLTYKAQLGDKIGPKKDTRVPVWVTTDAGRRPGLLITEQGEEAMVFFPNSPDSNNGEVLMVAKQRVQKLDMSVSLFIKSMQKFGKDLAGATP